MTRRLLVLSVLALPAMAGTASAEWHVWTVKPTQRVLRDEPAGKGTAVSLAAARNEWESFQVFLRADEPVEGVVLQSADLLGPDGAVLPARTAQLFREHQLEITSGTPRNSSFRPGWYPDPLIPLRHPATGEPLAGARLAAAPFSLPAAQTHGFWVDVYVPADARAGVYRGTYRVTASGGRAVEVPVTLTVWDFALPAVSTMRTSLGSPAGRMRGYYRKRAKEGREKEPADWDAVEAQCAELLSQHRIDAWPPNPMYPVAQPDGTFRIPPEQIQSLRQFVDRYHVGAVCVPHPHAAVKDPEQQADRLRAWLAAWDRAAAELGRPYLVFYTYLRDEPNEEEAYRYVQKWGRAIRAAKSVVKVLVVEQTLTQNPAWGVLDGAIDIWCPLFCLHDHETAAKRLALGETLWTYTALCQGKRPSPWWHIDYPLLNYRVPAWIAWGDRMCGLLYWGGMSHWDEVDDPWTDPATFRPGKIRKGAAYNGEGTLVYPGRAVGYNGIAPSLRLKALRDGIEDFEYLALLERRGLRAEAEKILRSVAQSWFEWNPDPAAYEDARAKLAALILRGK